MHMRTRLATLALGVGLMAAAGQASAQSASPTIDAIKARGVVNCGVNTGLAGFSILDSKGAWTGLDVDTCRAVAAALLGSGDKVKFFPLDAQQRFQALQSGSVDMLARNTTWTLTRDTALGLSFAPVTFFDGQGFMVSKKLGVKSAKELNGATVCVQPGTTTELNLADFFRANKMEFKPVVIEAEPEVEAAFFSGRCDAFTTDGSGLASVRVAKAGNADDYIILPERISKEPLAPAYRSGDNGWGKVVDWTVYALFQAEESGVTKANVDEMKGSSDPTIKRLLGVTPGMGKALGLDEAWAYNAIKAVGNYGEIYDRNVGKDSPLKLDRGLNAQWTKGGLIYAIPLR